MQTDRPKFTFIISFFIKQLLVAVSLEIITFWGITAQQVSTHGSTANDPGCTSFWNSSTDWAVLEHRKNIWILKMAAIPPFFSGTIDGSHFSQSFCGLKWMADIDFYLDGVANFIFPLNCSVRLFRSMVTFSTVYFLLHLTLKMLRFSMYHGSHCQHLAKQSVASFLLPVRPTLTWHLPLWTD